MKSSRSFADTIRDWQQLMSAYGNNTGNVSAGEPLLPELQTLLTKALELKGRQENLKAVKQRLTKEIGETVKSGTEVVLRMRSHAKGSLGTRNEALVEFKVTPRRERGPRKQTAKPPVTAPGGTPPPQPTVKASEPVPPAAKPAEP